MEEKMEVAQKHLGWPGAMISWSKSDYSSKNRDHLTVFNANVCVKNGKIWFGDIDVSLSRQKLSDLSKSLNEDVYVLREMDGRFDNEKSPLLDKAVVVFSPDGSVSLRNTYEKNYKNL